MLIGDRLLTGERLSIGWVFGNFSYYGDIDGSDL
jgi:hypothetical protein